MCLSNLRVFWWSWLILSFWFFESIKVWTQCLCLLGIHSTTWTTLPAIFILVVLDRVLIFWPGQLALQSFYVKLSAIFWEKTYKPLCSVIDWDKVLWTFCLVWPWTLILPILASHITRIVAMSHWHMIFCLFPDFKRNVFNFYLFCKMLARHLWYIGFFVVWYSHSILSSFKDFYNELMLSSFKEFSCIYWGDFYCLFCLCAVLHVVIRICQTTLYS
jgi:hypothetical protein